MPMSLRHSLDYCDEADSSHKPLWLGTFEAIFGVLESIGNHLSLLLYELRNYCSDEYNLASLRDSYFFTH